MAFSTFSITFAEDLGLEIVDIFVGAERKRFVVHKKLLVDQSEYFHKALTGSFMEAEENSIHLKEEDPAAVALLIGWLYRGAIPGTENYAGPFARPIFSGSFQVPISEQGTLYPFIPTPQAGNGGQSLFGLNQTETYQHICHESQYIIFSPEELRLADYKLNRKYQSDLPTASVSAPATVTAPPPPQPVSTNIFGTTGSYLFTQIATTTVTQPAPPQPVSLFASFANQAPNHPSSGHLSQPNTTQRPSIFASVYNQPPLFPPSNGLSVGTAPASRTPSLFGVSNNSTSPPNSNIFGGSLLTNPMQNISSGLNNSQAPQAPFPTFSFGSATSPHPQPTAGRLFSNPPGLSLSTATATSQPTRGLFGPLIGRPQNSTFSGSPNTSNGFGQYGVQAHYSIYEPNTDLPPGAAMTTINFQKPKPGQFGYYPAIKHMKSPEQFINGIPRTEPSDEQFIDLKKQQLALLNLCIMAETMCWPTLFNVAINAYIRGEHKLLRSINMDAIDRIYARTHPDSTLRTYVVDSIRQLKQDGVDDLTPYMEMAHKHQDFLADLLSQVIGSSTPPKDVETTIENYHMYGMDENNGDSEW